MAEWSGGLASLPPGAHSSFEGKRVALVGAFDDRAAVVRRIEQCGGKVQEEVVAGSGAGEEATQIVIVGKRAEVDPQQNQSGMVPSPRSAAAAKATRELPPSQDAGEALLESHTRRKRDAWQRGAVALQLWMQQHPRSVVADETFAQLGGEELRDRLIVWETSPDFTYASSPRRDLSAVAHARLRVGTIAGPERAPGQGISPAAFGGVDRCGGHSRTVAADDVRAVYLLLYCGVGQRLPQDVGRSDLLDAIQHLVIPHHVQDVVPDPDAAITFRDGIDAIVSGVDVPGSAKDAAQARAEAIARARDFVLSLCVSSMWRNPFALVALRMPPHLVIEDDRDAQSFPLAGVQMHYRWELDVKERSLDPSGFQFSPGKTDAARLRADPADIAELPDRSPPRLRMLRAGGAGT